MSAKQTIFLTAEAVTKCSQLTDRLFMSVSHLTGLGTLRIKLDLLGSQLPPSIHIVTQVNATKRSLAQELPPPPRHRSTGC